MASPKVSCALPTPKEQLSGGEELEPRLVADHEAQVEAALEAGEVGGLARDADPGLADQLEGEALGRQVELAHHVGAVLAEALEHDRLVLGLAGRVDLQRALGGEEEAVVLELLEVGLQGRHAPELRGLPQPVAHVEHEPAGGRSDSAELVEVELAGEGEDEGVVGGVDLQHDLGGQVHQRLVLAQPRDGELDAAAELDEERLGRLDQAEAAAAREAEVAVGVAPGAGEEVDRGGPDAGGAGVEVAVGVLADLDDLGAGGHCGESGQGATESDLVARGVVRAVAVQVEDRAALADGTEDHVEPHPGHRGGVVERQPGHGRGAGLTGRRVEPGAVDQGGDQLAVLDAQAREEEAVDVGGADPDRGSDQRQSAAAGAERDLGCGVEDAGRVGAREGDVDPAAAVEVDLAERLAVGRVGQRRGRVGQGEGLGLGCVRGGARVAEGAGDEGEGVAAGSELTGEAEAVDVALADPDRAAERDEGAVGLAEHQLVAVDAGVVERVAGGRAEPDLEVAAVVEPLAADGGSTDADGPLGLVRGGGDGADEVAGGAGDEEALALGPLLWWRSGAAAAQDLVQVQHQGHLARLEGAGQEVAVDAVAESLHLEAAADQVDARGPGPAEGELVAVDVAEQGAAESAGAGPEDDVDVGLVDPRDRHGRRGGVGAAGAGLGGVAGADRVRRDLQQERRGIRGGELGLVVVDPEQGQGGLLDDLDRHGEGAGGADPGDGAGEVEVDLPVRVLQQLDDVRGARHGVDDLEELEQGVGVEHPVGPERRLVEGDAHLGERVGAEVATEVDREGDLGRVLVGPAVRKEAQGHHELVGVDRVVES